MTGIPDHMKKKMHEMRSFVDRIAEEMHEEIKKISPDEAPKILDEAKIKGFTLGKMFETVQFHISGEVTNHGTSPLSRAVTGGKDIGENTGYGPATFLSKEDVAKAAEMLSKISEKEFLTKYSSDDWAQEETENALIYFKGLACYYNEAAKAGHAMLVWGA